MLAQSGHTAGDQPLLAGKQLATAIDQLHPPLASGFVADLMARPSTPTHSTNVDGSFSNELIITIPTVTNLFALHLFQFIEEINHNRRRQRAIELANRFTVVNGGG